MSSIAMVRPLTQPLRVTKSKNGPPRLASSSDGLAGVLPAPNLGQKELRLVLS